MKGPCSSRFRMKFTTSANSSGATFKRSTTRSVVHLQNLQSATKQHIRTKQNTLSSHLKS
jgi:hypothetical protein